MHKSISVKVVAILLLVLTVGQGVGAYLFISSARNDFMGALHARMKRGAKQNASILAEPLVNYNTPLVTSFITESLKDGDISSIKVIDKNGNTIKEGMVDRGEREHFTLSEPILADGETVGTFKMVYTAKTIDDSIRRSRILIPLYQLGMLLVMASVLIWLFRLYVKLPVERLNKAISGITGGDLTVEVPVLRDDEIGTIASGVRFLVQRLRGTVARINTNSDKVTKAVRQLNDTFDRVRHVIDSQNASTGEVSCAVRDVAESQLLIVTNTDDLLSLSNENLSSLLQMQGNSEEIAGTTDDLNKNLQDSYSALTELAQSAKGITHLADDAASFVSATSSSAEEVYRSVKHAESLINESARISTATTAIISEKGMVAIDEVTDGMKRIGIFIGSLMSAIENLGGRSRDIGKILGVMEEVTAQSRLLSLNAQIIAAQAGENGKSFAVVAEEMRLLSDKAALSTQEIDTIVKVIQHEIEQVVKETHDSVDVVRDGETVVGKTANVLMEILETSRQATDLAKGIERASIEQTEGLKHVVNSTEQVRQKIDQVNRATSEQEKGTAFLLQALNPIKDAMVATKRGTEEQVKSTRFISANIELANQKSYDIARASSNQQELNQRVLEALEDVKRMGSSTVEEVKRLIPVVSALLEDMDALRLEMSGFTVTTTSVGAGDSGGKWQSELNAPLPLVPLETA
ncbi:HAMP domain-containing protein [Geomonas nitrogeniifigens]|uniref:methyl-accepting chemotaxis protein n=1 Tax=Geomonas diazotrophica TaxID=2843197 RepID=UPI001C2BD23D|nr:methyl-accepting chemotaxis protein [Geomonas nitrogeniifigens]QXE88637.1 HAMP domain-containing protein [Geomonas nitrogeniifigens]